MPGTRHGISRLPDVEGDKPKRQTFKRDPIGFLHIDIAEVQTVEGKLCLLVGIDRTSRFAVTQVVGRSVDKADRRTAWEFLALLLKAVPHRIHTILTDRASGCHRSKPAGEGHPVRPRRPRNRNTASSRQMRFDMICAGETVSAIGPRTGSIDIEHRLTRPDHP